MKVTIRNFQSLKLVNIDAQGLTVLVGPSNIGKSALIRAIESLLFNRAGDDFVRQGESSASVEIDGLPTKKGKTYDVGWYKGKGINYYKIDGEKYDKVARETPFHITEAGYQDVDINDEPIRPQVADQFEPLFLLKRSGSFIHDVIAQASRLSVLLRADRFCSSDLKRQKQLQKIRTTDLDQATDRLQKMEPIRELHSRIQLLKPKRDSLKKLNERLEDLKEMASDRKALLEISKRTIPASILYTNELKITGEKVIEGRVLLRDRTLFKSLPSSVPSERPIDWEGLLTLSKHLEEARNLVKNRLGARIDFRDAQISHKSILQESDISETELNSLLATIDICPVCDQPMPKTQSHEVHTN